jgi:hypothetical protein
MDGQYAEQKFPKFCVSAYPFDTKFQLPDVSIMQNFKSSSPTTFVCSTLGEVMVTQYTFTDTSPIVLRTKVLSELGTLNFS